MTVRVLLDNDILSGAECMQRTAIHESVEWAGQIVETNILGFVNKPRDDDEHRQLEKDALHTVGRLMREGGIEAFTYVELNFERVRARPHIPYFNALRDCQVSRCPSALERSKFRATVNFRDHVKKGGKKDEKQEAEQNQFSQIAFLEWVLGLNESDVQKLLTLAETLGLTPFEAASLKDLPWFKALAQRYSGRENLVDAFHIWTAERNDLDFFLTLEKKMTNAVGNARSGKHPLQIKTKVVGPTTLLRELGVVALDAVPYVSGRMYKLHEVT